MCRPSGDSANSSGKDCAGGVISTRISGLEGAGVSRRYLIVGIDSPTTANVASAATSHATREVRAAPVVAV
jgi:hypothetical protein